MENEALDLLHNALLEKAMFLDEEVKKGVIKLLKNIDDDMIEAEMVLSDETNDVVEELRVTVYGEDVEEEDSEEEIDEDDDFDDLDEEDEEEEEEEFNDDDDDDDTSAAPTHYIREIE